MMTTDLRTRADEPLVGDQPHSNNAPRLTYSGIRVASLFIVLQMTLDSAGRQWSLEQDDQDVCEQQRFLFIHIQGGQKASGPPNDVQSWNSFCRDDEAKDRCTR